MCGCTKMNETSVPEFRRNFEKGCFRCERLGKIQRGNLPSQKVGNFECETCRKWLCMSCHKIHERRNECFCENGVKRCYICGEDGFYDYSISESLSRLRNWVSRVVCQGHL